MQQVEQGGAMDADAVRQGMQVGVAQVEDRAAAIGACLEPDDARAARDRGVGQAEFAQHGEPGRLQQQSGTDRLRLGEALVDRDPVAPLREQRRGGLARHAAADDRDVEGAEELGHLLYITQVIIAGKKEAAEAALRERGLLRS